MIELMQWAAQWGVSIDAVRDLERRFGVAPEIHQLPDLQPGRSEAAVSADAVRQARELHGAYLWRNNSGAYSEDKPPSPGTRWGLGNDSAKINKVMKTPDFVGIWPFHIGPEHVGQTVGQFAAIEMKAGNWTFRNTEREIAQRNYLELVVRLNGKAFFHNGGPLL